ncbi:MAG TPA: hypothetical protein VIM73_04400 [Polyangiaceae bacterium]
MSRPDSLGRVSRLLVTARSNPEFGRRLVQELPQQARDIFVSAVAKPEQSNPLPRRPGIAKCAASPYADVGLAAQLLCVARQAARVR